MLIDYDILKENVFERINDAIDAGEYGVASEAAKLLANLELAHQYSLYSFTIAPDRVDVRTPIDPSPFPFDNNIWIGEYQGNSNPHK